MNFRLKKIFIPNGQQEELTAFENWTVRWRSCHGYLNSESRDECEVFLNEENAKKFANQLKNAFQNY
jgi:hypothetical protein